MRNKKRPVFTRTKARRQKKREEEMETTRAKKETAVIIPINEKARNGGIKEV